ncbi:Heparan sulfate glucosamine 3-O-sulfotransferase 5 [Orchesella cincta]|uniref:Heparan sulfate glucosamine 3-O-sulfotransferase 5 n=1 Tax=Orchesella cincta TaxID=48709 RepID=A0A1D2MJM0_ORCCI|nr:Heparan sulfate glucosamine 3-O-sulfotransferase 5 [Orchesella cincta]
MNVLEQHEQQHWSSVGAAATSPALLADPPPDGSINTNYKATRISIYSRYLQRWLDIFPTSQIHVIDGDALIRDPFTQLQEVEKFLNLHATLKREDFYFNSTKGFYCWKKRNENNDTAHNTVHCLNDSKGRKHPNVDRRVIRKLREFYRPFNEKFYNMVGRDFGWPET